VGGAVVVLWDGKTAESEVGGGWLDGSVRVRAASRWAGRCLCSCRVVSFLLPPLETAHCLADSGIDLRAAPDAIDRYSCSSVPSSSSSSCLFLSYSAYYIQ
jgi:hypothetical protein